MKKAKKDKAKKPEIVEAVEVIGYTERPDVEVEELSCTEDESDCFFEGEILDDKNIISIEKLF